MIIKDTNIICEELYPFVKKALDKRSKEFLTNIHKFINDRHTQLFSIAPYENIYFNKSDLDKLYAALGFKEADVVPMLRNIWFWDQPVNPGCVKEPYVLILMCCIRYYLKNNERKNAELTSIYLAFSGKIYASIYGMEWKFSPKNSREVMDYVVNNMISEKFDLKKEGSVFKAIQKLCITWLDAYGADIKAEFSDDDCKIFVQQLRDRVKSFLKNIAKLFYEAYNNKYYMNYETDSIDQSDFHITTNDAALASKITEATMNVLMSQKVDLKICDNCKNVNLTSAYEIATLMEGILSVKEYIPEIRRVINILICDYMENGNKDKKKNDKKRGPIGSKDFFEYSIQAKPNTKSPTLIEMKETIQKWLTNTSTAYRQRTREATRNNYVTAVRTYLTLTICKVAVTLF